VARSVTGTATNAAPVVLVDGVAGQTLDELAFDIKNGSWCGAGSPRFNVTTVESGTHFYACYYGTKTDLGNGWTRVTFGPDTPFAGNAFGETIVRIQIVVDEGNDLSGNGTPGQSVLDAQSKATAFRRLNEKWRAIQVPADLQPLYDRAGRAVQMSMEAFEAESDGSALDAKERIEAARKAFSEVQAEVDQQSKEG